jgi:hypothetical protein
MLDVVLNDWVTETNDTSCYGMDVSRFPASIARHKGGKHVT